MLIVGDKEAENNQVSVRHHSGGDLGAVPLDAFITMLKTEVDGMIIK